MKISDKTIPGAASNPGLNVSHLSTPALRVRSLALLYCHGGGFIFGNWIRNMPAALTCATPRNVSGFRGLSACARASLSRPCGRCICCPGMDGGERERSGNRLDAVGGRRNERGRLRGRGDCARQPRSVRSQSLLPIFVLAGARRSPGNAFSARLHSGPHFFRAFKRKGCGDFTSAR